MSTPGRPRSAPAANRFFAKSSPTIAFALVSALLAAVVMTAMETPVIDAGAYQIAVIIAAVVGFFAAIAAEKTGAFAVVGAGAVFGMAIQALLFVRLPWGRAYFMTSEITTHDPLLWVAAGAPLGAIPAIGAAALHWLAMRAARTRGRPAPQDAAERVLLPIAGAAAVLSGLALAVAHTSAERVADLVIMVLACAALVEIVRADRARMRWLADVFNDSDPTFGVLVLEAPDNDLPLVVGGVEPAVVLTRVASVGSYRATAHERWAAAAFTAEATVRPLARRVLVAAALAACGPLCAALAYVVALT